MNAARQVVTYLCSCTLMLTAQPRAVVRPQATDPHDGQRDFDFEIGRWRGEGRSFSTKSFAA